VNGEKGIKRFEDLIAWQKSRELTKQIYQITEQGKFVKDFGLRDQVRRASVSVMSNIAEGFERHRPTEFHQFLSIAKGSCAEMRSQLYVAVDVGYLTDGEFKKIKDLAEETTRIISGLRSYIEKQRK